MAFTGSLLPRLLLRMPKLIYASACVESEAKADVVGPAVAATGSMLFMHVGKGARDDDVAPAVPVPLLQPPQNPGPFTAARLLQLELEVCDNQTLRSLRCPALQSLTLKRCRVTSLRGAAECFPRLIDLHLSQLYALNADSAIEMVKALPALEDFR